MPHTSHRPTSPHLTIYRPQITTVLSILHRFSGIALYAGSFLLVAWLWTAAYSIDQYDMLHTHMVAWYGQLLLLGWTVAFYFHLANGIRHLFWDIGKGFELKTAATSGWAVVLFTAIATGATWGYVMNQTGGL